MQCVFRLSAIVLALLVQSAGAVDSGANAPPRGEGPSAEPHNTGWSAYIDNDWFRGADRNYTAGFAVGVIRTARHGVRAVARPRPAGH
jgi:hypothetical protein